MNLRRQAFRETRRAASAIALPLLLPVLLLAACAQVPDATRALPWTDRYGDRGIGVRDRDLAQCAEVVEQRRSALAGCMARKGWALDG